MDQTADEKPIEHEGNQAETGAQTTPAQASKPASRNKSVAAFAVLALIVAVVFGVLYFTSRVPSDAAAKVNDSYIAESEVTSYIAQYRASQSLTDDTALAQALSSQGLSIAQFRINAIDQIATTQLVNARAEELGVTPSDEEVQAQIDAAKSSIAFNDDSIWQRTLEQYGLTEDQVREQNRDNLAQNAVLEQDVPHREATDAETLSWAKTNLAGSEQHHYATLVFSGKNAEKKASKFQSETNGDLATESFANAEALAASVKARAKKAGASIEGGLWTIGLDSSSELAETLNGLSLGDLSDVQTDEDAGTAAVYLYDENYTFPSSAKIDSLKKKKVPSTLWTAVASKASDALWSSDCSAYLANLLAQAKVTYYPLPDDAPYKVDLSKASASSSSSEE